VSTKMLKPKRGSFAPHRTFREEGHYRLLVRFAGDTVNAPGASPYVEITVQDPLVPL
jgi:hypothetical protein